MRDLSIDNIKEYLVQYRAGKITLLEFCITVFPAVVNNKQQEQDVLELLYENEKMLWDRYRKKATNEDCYF